MNRRTSCIRSLLALVLLLGASSPVAAAAPPTGDHIVVHFRMEGTRTVETAVLAVEDADGDLVLIASVDGDRLHVSDGRSGGVDRPYVQVSTIDVGRIWHRLDVVLHGTTFTAHLDQKQSVTARTFEPATAGTYVNDPRPLLGSTYESVLWARHRVDDGSMAYDETFTSSTMAWSQVVDGGSIALFSGSGHQGVGYAEVAGGYGLGATYLRAPTTGLGGTYGLQTSVASLSGITPPTGIAALAGLAGTAAAPDVQWAVVMDRVVPRVNQWALYFEDADGVRTQVSPGWVDTGWHTVQVSVDEAADQATVVVDGGAPVVVSGELGTSTHAGAGDVFAGLPYLVRTVARYDDLALYEEAS